MIKNKMNSKITIDVENLNNEEREQLMKLIGKASKGKESKIWKPKYNQGYYAIVNGEICNYYWNNVSFDERAFAVGDLFLTREEAEYELERRKILTQWKRLSIEAGEDENPWGENNRHYFAYYSYNSRSISFDFSKYCRSNRVYFPSMESLSNAIKTIGEENVKRYVLGVKE